MHRHRTVVIGFYCALAAVSTVLRRLINQARIYYRWPSRPHPAPPRRPK